MLSMPGSTACEKKSTWDIPIVATSRISRGASKRRRTIASSRTAPSAAAMTSTRLSARKKFQPTSSTSFASTAAPNAPSSP
jgi:hypothetical protein